MALFGFKKQTEAQSSSKHQAMLSNGTTVMVARQVDCIGDVCPRPQLMTKKALGEVAVGDVVEVIVDNPSSMEALPAMCAELNATHLETKQGERCWQVFIRKD